MLLGDMYMFDHRPIGRRIGVPGSRRPRGVAEGAPGVAMRDLQT